MATPDLAKYDAAEMERRIAPALLHPLSPAEYDRLAQYTALLYRWNARMNLTAVEDPKLFAELHLAECIFSGQLLSPEATSVLDFGSGAGLPGIPLAITCPQRTITLAESQSKKAAFLREANRELQLKNAYVLHGRVENMPPDALFDVVMLRAVDNMASALRAAYCRVAVGGWCYVLSSEESRQMVEGLLPELCWHDPTLVPRTTQRIVLRGQRVKHL